MAEGFSVGASWVLVNKLGQIATALAMKAEKSLEDVEQDFPYYEF